MWSSKTCSSSFYPLTARPSFSRLTKGSSKVWGAITASVLFIGWFWTLGARDENQPVHGAPNDCCFVVRDRERHSRELLLPCWIRCGESQNFGSANEACDKEELRNEEIAVSWTDKKKKGPPPEFFFSLAISSFCVGGHSLFAPCLLACRSDCQDQYTVI